MFTRILVPLDGSELAERAVPVAARIARVSGASVLLTRVLLPNYVEFYEPAFRPYQSVPPRALEAEVSEAKAYLARIGDWPVLSGIAVETYPVAGMAAPCILQLSIEQHADLVVMTSHGRTGLSRWVLGSVAQHLARQSTVPVLVLRTTTNLAGEGGEVPAQPVRVLVTLDGPEAAEAALGPAADLVAALATKAPGELHLLMVVDRYLAALAAAPESLLVGGAEGYLGRVAERLRRERGEALRTTWSVSADTDIAAAIVRVAGEGVPGASGEVPAGVDLITMATHGRTGFARWALGSVTERVLQGTKLPMLIVRPRHITAEASPLVAVQG